MDTKRIAASLPGRREFIKGLGAASAWTLIPTANSPAQTQKSAERRKETIDVHHHYVSPSYFASLSAKNAAQNLARFKGDTPDMHIAEMDKAGVGTAMLAQYSGFWFGDVDQARRDAREINEWAAAKT